MSKVESKSPVVGKHETNKGVDDTKVRYQDDEGKTQEREPEEPIEGPAAELPEPTGTDRGQQVGIDPGEDADGFNKETGFFEAQDDKGK